MRIRLDLTYDGAGFHGWAAQPGLRTVQGELEAALRTVLRHDDVTVTCAGRTDTGVHARGQVTHLDLPDGLLAEAAGRARDRPVVALRRRVNGVLDPDVRVRRVGIAPEGFDARFSALWRRYVYRVADDPASVDPLTRGHVLAWPRPLDVEAMDAAAQRLLGEHDFAAFCRRREGATTIRTLLDLRWERSGAADGLVVGTVRADAFCHSMVRALTGCLISVGEGRRDVDWPAAVLSAGVRDPAVTVAPAHGLTLEEVRYPEDADLSARQTETRRVRTL
ncbi:tRNA pseudouridine(38-40) synthase TruA [uncultured Nocardioides sp.]|uniref:tRNA pseudouridine(38-40) synthase TruA n=1 Tax=uncultured Nocardioides sp. TaxID=198441 RepID=UPI00262D661B|nr:tRNA pseudouridine(38-40) synthase TruA [uncultured Nocardioides sp.]